MSVQLQDEEPVPIRDQPEPKLVRMIPNQTSLRLMETFPSNCPLSLLTVPLEGYIVRMQIVVVNVHYHKS